MVVVDVATKDRKMKENNRKFKMKQIDDKSLLQEKDEENTGKYAGTKNIPKYKHKGWSFPAWARR